MPLVTDHAEECSTRTACIAAVAKLLGASYELLRHRANEVEVAPGFVTGCPPIPQVSRANSNASIVTLRKSSKSEGGSKFFHAGERSATLVICTFIAAVAGCTAERLMRAHGWRGVTRRKKVRTPSLIRPRRVQLIWSSTTCWCPLPTCCWWQISPADCPAVRLATPRSPSMSERTGGGVDLLGQQGGRACAPGNPARGLTPNQGG